MDAPSSFGAWMRQRRRALDLTQDQLANRVGLSASAVRKIESDERRPSREVAELLAESLEVASADRNAFLKAARGELSVSHSKTLTTALATPPPPPAAPVAQAAAVVAQRPTSAPRPALPVPPTPLVGRTNELLQIDRLLADPTCRLLTLVGPGGIGKTRVALEAARRQQAFADGVYFVPLAGVSTPALLAPTIASAIGLLLQGASEPQRQVIHHLQSQALLLVLDNLEHLLTPIGADTDSDIGWLAELLNQAPEVKLLATSREPLGLPGEWLIDLYGLPTPPASAAEQIGQSSGAPEALERFSSVELFLQTARRIDTHFALAAQDYAAIVRICRLVDGLPLGIELAASWVRTLSCAEIADEIERNLDFLATSARGAPERHRSITAVFDHSWRLLDEAERQALRRLSVLRGGFTREAAERVATARLPLLSALVAKSLVRHNPQGRYDLHELVRQYAATHLQQDPAEEQATRNRHSIYYQEWLRRRGQVLSTAAQKAVQADFMLEADNLRAAWRWIVAQRDGTAIQSVTAELVDFYDWLGWFQEGERLFAQAVQELVHNWPQATIEPAEPQAGAVGCVLLGLGAFGCRIGHYEQAQVALTQSLTLLRPLGEPRLLTRVLYWLTMVAHHLGRYGDAQAWAEEGLALAEIRGEQSMIARLLNLLGFVSLYQGAYPQAQERFEAALEAARQLGNPNLTILLLNNLSSAHRLQGHYEVARGQLQESVSLAQTVGEQRLLAFAQGSLGQLAYELGDYAEAVRWFEQSLALLRMINETWGMTGTLRELGQTALALGEIHTARRHFGELLQLAVEAGLLPRTLDALVGIAQLEAHDGNLPRALSILTQVAQQPAVQRETKDRAERLRIHLAESLTPDQIAQIEHEATGDEIEKLVAHYRTSYRG